MLLKRPKNVRNKRRGWRNAAYRQRQGIDVVFGQSTPCKIRRGGCLHPGKDDGVQAGYRYVLKLPKCKTDDDRMLTHKRARKLSWSQETRWTVQVQVNGNTYIRDQVENSWMEIIRPRKPKEKVRAKASPPRSRSIFGEPGRRIL